ncbi:MAG: hypothetical protein AB1847_11705 [bacterium]
MATKISVKSILLVIGMMLFLLTSCDKVDPDSIEKSSGSGPIPGSDIPVEIGAIDLSSVNKNTVIRTNSNLTIKVDLITASGQPLSSEAMVSFALSDPTRGKIASPVLISGGSGTVDFTSKDREGIVKILASSGTEGNVLGSLDVQISDVTPPAKITCSADPNTISIKGTSHIKAMVLDSDDQPVVDGTQVNFQIGNELYGTVTESALTVNGSASATFKASVDAASQKVQITAQAGSASGDVTVSVASADVGSIEFVSAEPNIIGLKGSGQVETSIVTFMVKNNKGDPIQEAQSVDIELFGPGGEEYIDTEGTDKITISTENGVAVVDVHSGVIPGPVTLTATVQGTELSTSSGVISIGGGKPIESHFSLSASSLNVEGLAFDGIESQITVRLADRHGNVEVLEGTTVSFYSESGGVSRSVALDKTGQGSVTFRTQRPIPHKTLPTQSEINFLNELNTYFGVTVNNNDPESPNPRDGLCTVIATVDGEEEFTDQDADGKYNLGEPFDDTYDDIFIDKDDDNVFNGLFEDLEIDRGGDGSFDGTNGTWDGNKTICHYIDLLITGEPYILTDFYTQLGSKGAGFIIKDNQSLEFHVFIGDENFNIPIAGTSYSISTSAGSLSGTKSFLFMDTSSTSGGPILSYVLCDDKPNDADPPKVAEVVITVSWNGGGANSTRSITCAAVVD